MKPARKPHLFGNLGGTIYVPLLLLTIALRFTCGKIKFWLMIKKFQNIMTMATPLEMACMYHGVFSNKITFLLTLRPRNTYALFKHYLIFAFLSHFLLL